MPREKSFPKKLLIGVTEKQYDYAHEEFDEGQISNEVRRLLEAHMGSRNGELEDLEKEVPELEARYLSMKKRIEELKEEKNQQEKNKKVGEDRIKETHEKLLEVLKGAYWDPAGIQKGTYKIYAEFSGLSVPELMEWVQEQAKKRDELES